MVAPVVETSNLKKTYMLGKVPVDALRGVNLKVEKGEILTILCPSDLGVNISISQAQSFFGTDECDSILVKLTDDDEATIESVSATIEETFSDQVLVISSTAVFDTI